MLVSFSHLVVTLILTSSSKLKPDSPLSIDEAVPKEKWLLSSNSRRDKVFINRDPRKRISHQDLPISSYSVVGRKISDWSSLREQSETKKKVTFLQHFLKHPLKSTSDFKIVELN